MIAETSDNDKLWRSYIYEAESYIPLVLVEGNARNQDKIKTYWYQTDHLGTPLGLINPNDLWYTQNSISDVFSQGTWKGKTVAKAIEQTKMLGRLPDGLQISYEKIIMPNGQEVYASLNNRTTYVAQHARLTNVNAIDKRGKGMNIYNKLTEGGSRLPSKNSPKVKVKKC